MASLHIIIPVRKNSDSYSALVARPYASRPSDSAEPGSWKTGTDYVEKRKKTNTYHLRLRAPVQCNNCPGSESNAGVVIKKGSVIWGTGIMCIYNQQIPQRAHGNVAPAIRLKQSQKKKTELFRKRVHAFSGLGILPTVIGDDSC